MVEDGFELGRDGFAVFLRHMRQEVVEFVPHTALTPAVGKVESNRTEHGLMPVRDTEIHLLDTMRLDVVEQVLPNSLILAFADGEGDHFALARGGDADERQDRRFVALIGINHVEICAIHEYIGRPFRQSAALPLGILRLQPVMHPRHDGWANGRARHVSVVIT